MPAGSTRYWSWLFASDVMRAPLLGIYALLAEWNALMDPAAERTAAHIKLAWWQEEIRRLAQGIPVHPISTYLRSLPGANNVDLTPLTLSIDAAATESSGAPLESAADLEPHAYALCGLPLLMASRLAHAHVDEQTLAACVRSVAIGQYLAQRLRDYRHEAHCGRVAFAVDELLAAGIENADLIAPAASAPLEAYLMTLRTRAARSFEMALHALPEAHRSSQRHLLVLAALGRKHLATSSTSPALGLKDMLLAWQTARRAKG